MLKVRNIKRILVLLVFTIMITDVVLAAVPVSVMEAERKEISSFRRVNGQIEAFEDIQISTKTGGIIEKIHVRTGDRVKKGQPLFQFEQEDIRIQLKQAEAAVEIARATLEKMIKGTSEEQIRAGEAGVKQAEAALRIARANLKMLQDGASLEDRANIEAVYQQALASYEGAKQALELVESAYQDKTAQKQQLLAAETQLKSAEKQVKLAEERLAQAVTAFEQVETEFRRIGYLYQEKAVSKNQYEMIESQYKNARSAVESARIGKEQADIALQGAKESYLLAEENFTNPIQLEQQLTAAKTQLKVAEANVNIARANLDKVEKGAREEELMIALSNVEQAEALLESAKAQFDQLKKGASAEDIQIGKANLKQAEAVLEQAEKLLEDTIIRSPIDGIVGQINFDEGEMIGPGIPVLNVVNLDKVYISVNVTEDQLIYLEKGQRVEARLLAFENMFLEGEIEYLAPVVNPMTQAFPVKILVENKSGRLRGGMFAEVYLPVRSKKEALVIPISAVLDLESNPFVYIIEENRAVRTAVETGIISGDYIEIVNGVEPGQKVVIKGQDYLDDKMPVEVVK
ncbi:MAG: efflux RND transporter periplasmic adaptor subunit [Halanaerobiaceae bacterium]|nr:efflux RND transporter periplasmic adaptor subunit [Halanaerobiaceae bacterium]